jgi:hypothetical protein
MTQKYANNAFSTLASPLNISATTMFVSPGHGARWPEIVAPDFAFTTLEDALTNTEVVKITAHASGSDQFTVERAQQGTTERNWSIGDLAELRMTAVEMTTWEADIDDLEATRSRHAGQVYTGNHDFSAASVVALPANTSIGNVSAAEILALDGITSNVQAQLDGKADITGETYTGTHDFTGATLEAETLPFGTSGDRVATVEYVNQATLVTALPGQTGNDGKVLMTDGVNARWQSISGKSYFFGQL